jgi:hypothetical protein
MMPSSIMMIQSRAPSPAAKSMRPFDLGLLVSQTESKKPFFFPNTHVKYFVIATENRLIYCFCQALE